MTEQSISIALIGSGGSGVMTAGSLLLEAVGRAGGYGLMSRSSGPQIRGGEAAAYLRLATQPVNSHDDGFDVLLAIDWLNADRFAAEIPLNRNSLIIGDPKGGEIPETIRASGAQVVELPLKTIAKTVSGGRPNMVALGVLVKLFGLSQQVLLEVLGKALGRKGEAALQASQAALEAGINACALAPLIQLDSVGESTSERWSISGNEAAGLGALRGGVRFVAAYPITPATEMLEWLAPALQKVGGVLVQAEDELASVNQIIGAAFGGTPALTATSGPGLALMTESIGLAVASETPIVVTNVMRGGPSTGIPTKSEQSDLNIALYGLHGDAPHLVLAPSTVSDCVLTLQWAVHLAETLQTAAIVLSDQALGQARAIIERPADVAFLGQRQQAGGENDENYLRYVLTGSGVSPMAVPGMAGCQYTADGLEHSQSGTPSSQSEDHHRQLDKRHDKLERFDYGEHWAMIDAGDDSDTAVITWGSSYGPVREAIRRLRGQGRAIGLIAPRLLAPVQPQRMALALQGIKRLLVVEQSHSRQFYHYLRAYYQLPGEVKCLATPGPLPIRPGQVYEKLLNWD